MNDLINEKILNILEKNSRMTINEISKQVNLSAPAVRERINKMVDLGIIKSYTINIDYEKLGYDAEILIEITIKNNRYVDFKKFISEQDNVDFCYRVSGDACFVFKVRLENMSSVESFIDLLQPYGHTKSQFIFSKVI
ncbi:MULTISPECIES: Lrp/AsnC family transcriptional regulator [Staphylococcus]|uniref:HTH-type transcriptional regulator LrpC n=1 Tax=Staphylococcus lugdunensis TaxID=28035 RepID=A0ABD4EG25_STALU|nr:MULTISPECIES: Lrp/AsnC family transcriptional regulator [Staphylococcus]ARJ15000.1 AsnC family transcriptional regulator [Staphylococcus lugdunensis]EFU83196.1 transcriptional regulator, ArsR family [Staphylococcus lugdunensis M23590]KXA38740.1 putative HTH-type transcriptional regulator LrpC [Staphylococcus lugdunensis]OFJ63974.1 AsnC family transcriptional regulator [Staphylococcus sp. HMSC077E11]OFM47900.1 AsnC family transcriptional regulator [Staphylococcus sp. HMSC077E12]